MINKILPAGRFGIVLSVLGLFLVAGVVWFTLEQPTAAGAEGESGTLEKMIVAGGNAVVNVDLNKLNGLKSRSQTTLVNFDLETNAFFKSLVFNDEFRGTLPSSIKITTQESVAFPANLNASINQLVFERLEWGGHYEYAVRDSATGFTFFNVDGPEFDYEPTERRLAIRGGRLLISDEFAAEMKRPSDAGSIVGTIDISATLKPIEITKITNGETDSNVLPAGAGTENNAGTVPGPDVVVGDLSGLAQFGSASGTQVGLAVGTDSCNFGTVELNWFQNPNNDHPVIPQNLYRMSGGTTNSDRFEQIGQSSVKHAFTALQNNLCQLGCVSSGTGTRLGSGCSDPYGASLNAGPNLGSRAWINPFTGAYPRNDSATPNNNHTGHTHLGPTHRILTEIASLVPAQNPGATYYAESQYVTPHEYAWCQANPTQCNMNNNVSYRRYNVTNSASPFSFSPAASTVRMKSALTAWTGATIVEFRPDPINDGIAAIGYKVTNPSAGVWRYEYAIYNQNLDRAVQSFGIPVGSGTTITNMGFHAPPQHPGSTADGTMGNAGFSNTPWATTNTGNAMTWSSETLAQNPNANAVRWGTLYNIRFDSNRPPANLNATVGFFKTGAPMTVQIQGPSSPTAAFVSIAGRVTNAAGQGLAGVRVSLADLGGAVRVSAVTSSFGYYQFDNVATGSMYAITPVSKRHTFTAQTISVNDNIAGLDFTALP